MKSFGKIKVGDVIKVKDVYGKIIRARVTKKAKGESYKVYYEYLDGNQYFGCQKGMQFSHTAKMTGIS